MSDNQVQWKPIIVSSLAGGGLMGTLEYATYNKRMFKSGELSERQFANIAEAMAKKFQKEEAEILKLKDKPVECYNRYFEMYKNCVDDAGRFVHDSKKISKEYFDTIKSTLNKLRLQQALMLGGLFALGCTALSLITNKIQAKKSNQIDKK